MTVDLCHYRNTFQRWTKGSSSLDHERMAARYPVLFLKRPIICLAGENAGSKLTKANDLGVSVISEAELQEMLK